MTFLEAAEAILSDARRPLTVQEITEAPFERAVAAQSGGWRWSGGFRRQTLWKPAACSQ